MLGTGTQDTWGYGDTKWVVGNIGHTKVTQEIGMMFWASPSIT